MASKSNTAILRLQLEDLLSGPAKSAAGSLRGLDGAIKAMGKSGAPGMQRLVKQLEHLRSKKGALENFAESRRGLKELWGEVRAGKAHLRSLEQGMVGVAKPTAKMRSEFNSARSSVKNLTQTMRDQIQAARQAERSLKSFSVNSKSAVTGSQQATRNEIAKTIREMRRLDQEARRARPSAPGVGSGARDVLTAIGGGVAAGTVKREGAKSFMLGVEFSKEAEFQDALGDFSPEARAALNKQAEKIGGDTRFDNADVVRAQTNILQGGIRDPETIMALTSRITDYALAMSVTLEEASETVRGSALSKRIKLSDAKAIGDFVDSLVWMAKNGGMKDEDVRQYMKYGGASTTGAGLPDAYSSAIAMLLKRSGVRGDEAGVFARSASSKLVAPTNKGRLALNTMGVDYSDFTTMPDAWNERGLGLMMKNQFGMRLTPEMKAEINQILADEEYTDPDTGETRSVASDAGEFVTRLSEVISPLFGEKMSALDAKALSKALGDYHKMSVESVDVVGLFRAIMSSSDTSLAKLNAYFTDKQGGRANMIAQQFPLFEELLKLMQNVPRGEAARIGKEANQGIYGDWTKLVGTYETTLTRISQDFEGATRPLINSANSLLDGFLNLDQGTRQLASGIAGVVGVIGGAAAVGAGGRIVGGLLRGGGAGGAAAPAAIAGGARGLLGRLGTGAAFMAPLLSSGRLDPEKEAGVIAALQRQRKPSLPPATTSAGTGSSSDVPKLVGKMEAATASWPFTAQQAMQAYVTALTTGGNHAEAEAAAIGSEIETALSVTGHPDVDTSRLQAALGIARQVASALTGGRVSPAPAASSGLPSFGGPRAKGGRVQAGKIYAVGERGPEPFIPDRSGQILPHGSLGGVSISIVNHIRVDGGATDSAVNGMLQKLDTQLKRSAQTAFGSAKPFGA